MEGLAVAAGITGTLTFAIQSSKVIWETLSGIKEAPTDVARLITAVNDLRSLLKQLEDLLNQNGLDAGTLSKDFESLIRKCALDLDQFEKQNCRFQASPDKKTWRRTWRSVKALLEKEKLHSMRMAILQHHSALGGHLAFENLKSSIGHTRLLADTNTSGQEASSAIRELTQQVQITTNQNLGCYESISKQTADYRANQEISNRASETLRQDILAVRENVGTGNVEIQKKLDSTSQTLDFLVDAVHRLSIGFSEDQVKTLTSMTTSLQSQIPKQGPKGFCSTPHPQSETCDSSNAKDSGTKDDTTEAGHRLSLSLRRLAEIAKDARTVPPSQEARLVLKALETIVDLMVDKPSESNNPLLKRKRTKNCDLMINEAEQEQEHKRIKGLLATSQSIILNPKTSGYNKIRSEYRVKHLTKAEVFVSPSGTLSIVSKSQNIPNFHSHQDLEAESNCQQTLQKYVGKATFWTNNSAFPYKISATVLQDLTCDGYHSLRPTLSYHAMVQFKSEVITTVKTGKLHNLKQLLQQGEASITDCDPAGRSLLSYATYYEHPDICEYLIKKGADLNSLEPSFGRSNLMTVPLAQSYQYKSLLYSQPSNRGQACYRLLLLSGTDPLIHDRKYGSSVLSAVITHGTIEELQMMLHGADLLIDPEESLDNFDKTMLLYLCSTPMHLDPHVEKLKFLLNFGVNVNATDKFGNTALHLYLSHGLKSYQDNWTIVKDFLMLLLQSIMRTGADPHVKNKFGIEASQVAYGHLDSDTWNNHLLRRTQLWDEVLTELGLDIAVFKSCCRACGCQRTGPFETRCDFLKKGAYLNDNTLSPMETIADDDEYEDLSTRSNTPILENNGTQTCFEVIKSDDEDDEDVQDHSETLPQSGKRDGFSSSSSSYNKEQEENFPPAPLDSTNKGQRDPEARPEDHHYHTTTNTTISNQEPKTPTHPIPDTRSRTFWNVI